MTPLRLIGWSVAVILAGLALSVVLGVLDVTYLVARGMITSG